MAALQSGFASVNFDLPLPSALHFYCCCCCCCCHFLQVGFFDDKVGPITLACIVMVTLVAITIMAFIDVLS
jgi:hypothetical protein